MERSTINRVFPVPPHAQCHYTALTLYQHRAQTANPTGAVLMLLSSTAPESRVGSARNRRASGLGGPAPPQAAIVVPYSLQSSSTLQWATDQLLCSSSSIPVTAEPCTQWHGQRSANGTAHRLHTQHGGSHGNHGHPTPSHRGHCSSQGHNQFSKGQQWGAPYTGTRHHLSKAWQNTVSSPQTDWHTGVASPTPGNP